MNLKEYKIVHFDTKREEYTSGFITLANQELENGDFISREKDNGELSIVTDFSSEIFLAKGTCFSGEEERQINRLVSGSSHESAEIKANEMISKLCQEEFEGEIDDSEVGSRIELMATRPVDDRGLPAFIEYWCKGECVSNPYQFSEELEKMAEDFPCHHYFKGGLVKVFTVNKTFSEMDNEAVEYFSVNVLMNYCDKMGKILWERYEDHHDGGREYKASYENMCWEGYLTEGIIENDSIECVSRLKKNEYEN